MTGYNAQGIFTLNGMSVLGSRRPGWPNQGAIGTCVSDEAGGQYCRYEVSSVYIQSLGLPLVEQRATHSIPKS